MCCRPRHRQGERGSRPQTICPAPGAREASRLQCPLLSARVAAPIRVEPIRDPGPPSTLECAPCIASAFPLQRLSFSVLIQEEFLVQRVTLGGTKTGIAYDASQLLFGGAIAHPGRTYDILLDHDRSNVVAAKAQSHLANFQPLCNPTRLHILKVGQEESRNGQRFQILDGGGFIPPASTKRCILRLEGPGYKRSESARLLLEIVED